jgi:hypothetical protein
MRPFVPPERQHYLKTEPGFICKRDRMIVTAHHLQQFSISGSIRCYGMPKTEAVEPSPFLVVSCFFHGYRQ